MRLRGPELHQADDLVMMNQWRDQQALQPPLLQFIHDPGKTLAQGCIDGSCGTDFPLVKDLQDSPDPDPMAIFSPGMIDHIWNSLGQRNRKQVGSTRIGELSFLWDWIPAFDINCRNDCDLGLLGPLERLAINDRRVSVMVFHGFNPSRSGNAPQYRRSWGLLPDSSPHLRAE